jgi:hypothetical protein
MFGKNILPPSSGYNLRAEAVFSSENFVSTSNTARVISQKTTI